jgi:DNA polymerase I
MKLVTTEYLESGHKPYIILFTRDGPTRKQITIDNFQPYFYVPVDEYQNVAGSLPKEITKALLGETVAKYITETPGDVPQLRKMFSNTWEAKVKFTNRYVIDKIPKIEKTNLRIQYTDVEENHDEEIISIAVFDNFLNKVVCFVWREDLKPDTKQTIFTFPSGYSFQASIRFHNSKFSMLQDYSKFVRSTDPDLLTGWYFLDYDMTEIIKEFNRTRGLNSSYLSPLGKCYVQKEERGRSETKVVCKGRVLWDMLAGYADIQPTRLPDNSLEAIAQKELGEGKKSLEKSIDELWRTDLKTLVEYNCKDAVLVYRIDKKCHLIDYYDVMRRWTGCGWENLDSNTQMWHIYILRKCHGKVVIPSEQTKKIARIPGAAVFEPTKGVHQWICLLDLKSLYPSIIITFNMSPETLVKSFANSESLNTLANGIVFKREPVGLLPSILLEMKEERAKFQVEMAKYPFGTTEYDTYFNLQTAIKVHMNALYGAMLYKNFPLATREIGESITFCGREIIKWVKQKIEGLGFRVLYGDTDSVFIVSKQTELPKIVEEFQGVVEYLNKELPNKVEELGGNKDYCQIKIEPKKIYEYLLIALRKGKSERAAKKRYAGRVRWAEGKEVDQLDVMGFEMRRSNSSEMSRDLQKKVFRVLFGYESRDNLKVYIKEVREILANNNPDLDYVGIPQGLSKKLENYDTDSPWVRGSRYANEYLGEKFTMGDKPKAIYVRQVPKDYPKTDVVCFRRGQSLPPGFVLDVNTMFEKSVVMKLEQIFDAGNISLEEVLYGQSSLDKF